MPPSAPKSLRLSHERRLHGQAAFQRVFAAKMRKSIGPFSLWTAPNELGRPRLGLSTSARVGIAVKRNRIKRLVREAFRLSQHDWPAGYDAVIVLLPHEPADLATYRRLLRQAVESSHQEWLRRGRQRPAAPPAA